MSNIEMKAIGIGPYEPNLIENIFCIALVHMDVREDTPDPAIYYCWTDWAYAQQHVAEGGQEGGTPTLYVDKETIDELKPNDHFLLFRNREDSGTCTAILPCPFPEWFIPKVAGTLRPGEKLLVRLATYMT